MPILFDRLAKILTQEIQVYQQLADGLEEFRRTIVDCQPDQILEKIKQNETLILQSKTIQEAKKTLIEKIYKHENVPSDQPSNLSTLCDLIEEPFRSQFQQTHKQIRARILRVKKLSVSTKFLTDHSLAMLNATHQIYSANELSDLGKKTKKRMGKFQTIA